MSAIAEHSGVTQSMIHHYFGSKQGLWEAVKRHAFDAYLANQHELLNEDESDVEAFVANLLARRFSFFEDNPAMARFFSWIQLSQDPMGMETGQGTGRKVMEMIGRLQDSGKIRSDITPENIFAMGRALTTYWFQSRHLIQYFSGTETVDQAGADAAYEAAVIKLFSDGLAAQDETN